MAGNIIEMVEQAAGIGAAMARLSALFLVPRWSVPRGPSPHPTGTCAFTPGAALGRGVDRTAPPLSKEHVDFFVLGSG